jgi:hypothetical protein
MLDNEPAVIADEEELLGLDVSKHGERASAIDVHVDPSVYNGSSIHGGSMYTTPSIRNEKKAGDGGGLEAVGPAEERLEVTA